MDTKLGEALTYIEKLVPESEKLKKLYILPEVLLAEC